MNIEDQTVNEQNSELEEDLYYKNAFTKTEAQVNLEVDNARIKCLTSKNSKFSLDEEGNLTVNSITINQTTIGGVDDNQSVCDLIYPVGSIYLSVSDISPSILFGGTWKQINDDAYLKIVSSKAGQLDGTSKDHKIPLGSMPSHTHRFGGWIDWYTKGGSSGVIGVGSSAGATSSTGGGEAYYPYYYGIYLWVRTD